MLSVIILAKNEAQLIGACIKSVSFADEVIVVDDDSQDGTVEVAKKNNARVINYVGLSDDGYFNDFSDKRDKGLKEAKGDWVLYVDADERVLAPLREEIELIISGSTTEAAFAIPRKNIILGEEKNYAAFSPDYVVRLFKKAQLKKWQGTVHEQPVYEGALKKLKNPLLHLTHRDVDSMVLKSLDWANIDAKLRLDAKHPPITSWRLFRILLTESWKQGVSRQGFFNGTVGTIDALLQVFSLFITYAKLWQLQRSESLKDTYTKLDAKLIQDKFKY